MKDLYEIIESQDMERIHKEIDEFLKVHHVSFFLATYLETFHDGRMEKCK